MAFELPALPYEKNALEPHISAETLEYHYGKHHNTYVVNLNNMVPGTEYEGKSLEDIIKTSSGGVFNNAAQIWNHTFYWNCLSPNGGGEPTGALAEAINKSFGSLAAFKEEFSKTSIGTFGSGSDSSTHLRAHETVLDLVCRLLLEKKKTQHLPRLPIPDLICPHLLD